MENIRKRVDKTKKLLFANLGLQISIIVFLGIFIWAIISRKGAGSLIVIALYSLLLLAVAILRIIYLVSLIKSILCFGKEIDKFKIYYTLWRGLFLIPISVILSFIINYIALDLPIDKIEKSIKNNNMSEKRILQI